MTVIRGESCATGLVYLNTSTWSFESRLARKG